MYGCMCTLFDSEFKKMRVIFKIETLDQQNVEVPNNVI